jgi:aryl-alcohol dehydrogenase-like predicted oxidoreductase
VNRIALGTAQFGLDYGVANQVGRVPDGELRAILAHARAAGVDTLDTAAAYGDSERRLGELGAEAWRIVTKVPPLPSGWADPAAWAIEAVEGSLQRLRVGSVAAVLLHRPGDLAGTRGTELYRGLLEVRRRGYAARIGVSIQAPEHLDALDGRYALDLVQAPLSLIDRRLVESGWLARLASAGVEVHARSAFLQGVLLMRRADRPAYFDRWAPLWDRWHAWLASSGAEPVGACLAFALSFPAVSRVVVGVDSLAQVRGVLEAAARAAVPAPPRLGPADPDLVDPSAWRLA